MASSDPEVIQQLEEKLLDHLRAEFNSLDDSRKNWETMWQDIGELSIPSRADFNTHRAKGENRRSRIFDSTPVRALTRFSSGLHNMLVPSTIPWFIVTTQDRQTSKDREVALWLEEAQLLVQDTFNRPSANFHPSIHEYMQDLGAFGTGVMMVLDRPGEGPYYLTLPLYDCYLAVNDLGRVDTLYRVYEHTAKELLDAFGTEVLPESVTDSLNQNQPYKRFECINVIKPSRHLNLPMELPMPYVSIFWLKTEKKIISIKGFNEQPFVCSRWDRNSMETYGRGPGIEALSDMKMINEMEKTFLKALQKAVDPPLMVPDDGFLSPIRTTPGGINYFRAGMTKDDRIVPMPTPQRIDYAEVKMNKVKEAINSAFYIDLMELPGPTAADGDVMRFTATEIAARQRDRLSILGPIVARQEIELLGPLIERTMSVMGQGNMFPQPPQTLMQQEVKFEYYNPISVAMRAGELSSISQLMQFMIPFAQIDPTVIRRFNTSKLTELGADILRVPPSVLKTEEELQMELRQEQMARQQQEQIAQQMAMAEAEESMSKAQSNRASAEATMLKAGEPI
ncbi:MAG: hypothetical protein CMB80_01375 [Flammeovirgaceae bacterium]|nr:hypothetical protein [Flammeovirgaceae bacterium]